MDNKKQRHIYYLKHKKYIDNKAKKYYINNKQKVLDYHKLYYLRNKEKIKEYQIKNRDGINQQRRIYSSKNRKKRKEYRKSQRWKIIEARCKAKRRQNLGFNLLYENIIKEKTEFHHINNKDVIKIPKDLHRLYNGKDVSYHRHFVNNLIWQIYGDYSC